MSRKGKAIGTNGGHRFSLFFTQELKTHRNFHYNTQVHDAQVWFARYNPKFQV